jgi:ABC-type Fe3+-citrate transport system substrate-binding protein
MVLSSKSNLQEELERQVSLRTGHRVRNLAIELQPERIILRGQTTTYHIKQLAQHGVWDVLPHVRLENVIIVDSADGQEPIRERGLSV